MRNSGFIKTYLIICLLLVIAVPGSAQSPDTQWTRVYYEPGTDDGHSIKETKNGYVIAGANWIDEQRNYDIYILKIGYGGDVQWGRTYGNSGYDVGYGLDVTTDGGFIVTGRTSQSLFLLRTDMYGDSLWMRLYPGTLGNSVIETFGGGYVAVGRLGIDLVVVKTDIMGNELWHRTYSNSYEDQAYSVCETSDGNIVVVGYAQVPSNGGTNMYLLKLNVLGDTLWTRLYNGDGMAGGEWVEETSDGGLIIVGRTTSFGPQGEDVYLIKTDFYGNVEWSNTFGGLEWDGGVYVEQTVSGGYFIGGYTHSFSNSMDFYFIKTDSQGNEMWSRVVGEPSQSDWGLSGAITSDGGYIMVGNKWVSDENWSDIYVVKLNSDLTEVFENNIADYNISIKLDNNYPNPFNATTTIRYSSLNKSQISISIYNLLGQKIETLFEGIQSPGEHVLTWDASYLPSGIYFARLETRCRTENIKMVLLK
jgi:hypothetical protein